jgi:hypothetical protein
MTVTERIDISGEEAEALLARVKDVLSDEDYRIIKGLIDTHLLLNQAVNEKSTSIKRLLKMIFGSKTEKGKNGGNSTGRKKTDKKRKRPKGMAETAPIPIPVQRRWRSATRHCTIVTPVRPAKMVGFTGSQVRG